MIEFINKKLTINALENVLRLWKEKSYCDKNELCDFCQRMVEKIQNNIEKVKKHKNLTKE
jgi:hypothetical protein